MKDLGNFYTYIPGGSRRQFLDTQPELLLDHVPVICDFVDEYIAKHNLNKHVLMIYTTKYENLRLKRSPSNDEVQSIKSSIDSRLQSIYEYVKQRSSFSDELLRQ